ncbi:MAG: hypothetical protein CMG13_04545 [Candidatus Marinimicrobia bacterium]|nr:hypothetical protein [Candidatus Neomarinimicrobiota bacterium]
MDTKRIFLAAFLIMGVWVFWQSFLMPPTTASAGLEQSVAPPPKLDSVFIPSEDFEEIKTTIKNNVFRAVLTNKNGGSFIEYELLDHTGSYNSADKKPWGGIGYSSEDFTSLIYKDGDGFDKKHLNCNPCIEELNQKISHVAVDSTEVFEDGGKRFKSLIYSLFSEEGLIGTHKITYGLEGSFSVNHRYEINRPSDGGAKVYSVLWRNGIRPAERYYWLDDQYSYAMYANKSGDSNYLTGNKNTEPMASSGELDWVGVRNLFFVSALVPGKESTTTGSKLIPLQPATGTHEYLAFGDTWLDKGFGGYGRPDYPSAYDIQVDFVSSSSVVDFDTFIAPLDYSLVSQSNIKNLDWIMTLGGSVLRPISKFIISSIQFLQDRLPFLGVGLILILFAFLVRVISGPLTKMSLRSTQKMQEVQPIIKKIQDKHKSDPKAMQMKIMQTYKEHNVNPLSGCLVMFLQWPIMIPPFIVFRSVVDFRGESFLWIKDLSEPDYLVSLPFHIPLLGTGEGWTGIGILPILMGITLFLTMKKTMTNMEGQNKIMMYGMNGMFVVLFNGFPAALNLYYVIYNLLNYLQQQKKDSGPSFVSKIKEFFQNQKK